MMAKLHLFDKEIPVRYIIGRIPQGSKYPTTYYAWDEDAGESWQSDPKWANCLSRTVAFQQLSVLREEGEEYKEGYRYVLVADVEGTAQHYFHDHYFELCQTYNDDGTLRRYGQ
jgi:hypothetical protein